MKIRVLIVSKTNHAVLDILATSIQVTGNRYDIYTSDSSHATYNPQNYMVQIIGMAEE